MVAWLVGLVLFAHGVGHSLGILQATSVATVNRGWNGESWLLTGAVGIDVTRLIGIGLWSVALIGFSAAAAAVVGWLPASSFGPVAIVSAVASLVALALFPVAFPAFSTIAALAVDVAVLVAVVAWHWEPGKALG